MPQRLSITLALVEASKTPEILPDEIIQIYSLYEAKEIIII